MSEPTDTPGGAAQRKPCIACREMIAADAVLCPFCRSPQSLPARPRLRSVVKWLGGITAVVSLALGLSQVQQLVRNWHQRRAEVLRLMGAGDIEMARQDYPAAFDSYGGALKIDPANRLAQEKDEQAAMFWLENAAVQDEETFTGLVNRILPVLDKGLETARGPRAADLLAHEGWANFLKWREARGDPAVVSELLRRALQIDPANVYAHAMSGFWVLWQNGSLDEARQEFQAALATRRARAYVRRLELHALFNRDSDEAARELFRVANEMRQSSENIDPGDRHRLADLFWSAHHERSRLAGLLSALGPEDRLATFLWVDAEGDLDATTRDFVVATIRELSGDRRGALQAYQSLRPQLVRSGSSLLPQVDAAIARLNR
jgi:tetratricopeptide (TPR) repeat protein